MAWKRKYPITSLEDLSPRETRKLVETVRNYEPEDEVGRMAFLPRRPMGDRPFDHCGMYPVFAWRLI